MEAALHKFKVIIERLVSIFKELWNKFLLRLSLHTSKVNNASATQRLKKILYYLELFSQKIKIMYHQLQKFVSITIQPVWKEIQYSAGYAARGWTHIVEFFLRLQIRLKLSLIVAISIIGTTVIIGTIVTQLQERESRLQTEALGNTITLGLNSVAKDNLLLSSHSVTQDYVKNYEKYKLPGLENLFVINREGTIVTSLNLKELDKQVSSEEWDIITKADTVRMIETPTSFRFVQATTINKPEGMGSRKILLGGVSVSFSKSILLAPINEMKTKIFLYSFVVSVLAIGLVYYVSKHFVKIIIVLSNAARRVGSGDLQVSVFTRMQDELGMLSREFNFMVVQIREKVEMQKFVSKSTVEMISGGKQLGLGGSRSTICVMFTDVRGFTSFSENHSPEKVVETLNHYLDLQTRIIHEHGGVVDKFLGDGIMAIFRNDSMIQNAVEAAVHIQKEIALLNNMRKNNKEDVLNVGVGIASGVAVLGSIGSHDRMDFTAIGDTVNLSSRLCRLAGALEIVVTDEIARKVKNTFPSLSQGNLPIKGKKEDVPVYKITYQLN